jgi:hypothetical protein
MQSSHLGPNPNMNVQYFLNGLKSSKEDDMRSLHTAVSSALVLAGAGHIVMTARYYEGLTPAAVWFAGAGLALVFLGLLNLVAACQRQRSLGLVCLTANLIGVAYGVAVVLTLPVVQAVVALVLMASVTVTTPVTWSKQPLTPIRIICGGGPSL